MARSNLTLLVIDSNVAIRADFAVGRTARLLKVWRNARPDTDDLPLLVESAAHDGGRLRGAVWVVWSELFAQLLRLDAKSMGLKGEELRAGLAFEAEPLSGIHGFESLVAYEQTSAAAGEREFSVLQARRDDVETIRDSIAKRGGRLKGILSPSGFPMNYPAAGASEEAWNVWLADAANQLSANSRRRELKRALAIEPPARAMSSGTRLLLSLAFAAIVILGCTLHHKLLAEPYAAKLRSDIKTSQDAKSSLDALDKQIAQLNSQKGDTERKIEHVKKTIDAVTVQRERIAGFLAMVAQERTDEIVILKIDNTGGEPSVHGLCMKPHLASDFAHKLGERSIALGWQPQTPKSQAKNLLPTGGPWTFELHFKDVLTTPELQIDPKTTKKGGR